MRVTGNLQVSFQVLKAIGNAPLDSANLQAAFDQTYVLNPPKLGPVPMPAQPPATAQQVLDLLISNVTSQVVRRMAHTKEQIDIKLPGGDLKRFRDKAKNGEWVSLYDDLDVMTEPGKPEDKANRRFLMGVAKEASAYNISDKEQARKELLAAVRHYEEASKIRADEKQYKESARRAEESILLLEGPTPNTQLLASGAAGDSSRSVGSSAEEAMTNDFVIQMAKKVSESFLINMIKGAKNPAFDVSQSGLLRLATEGVPEGVIKVMMDRAKK
jgi:hypothetical protein